MVYTWPGGLTDHANSFLILRGRCVAEFETSWSESFSWNLLQLDVTEIDAHKNTQNRTKVCDTSHEDLYVYRRMSGETLGKYLTGRDGRPA